MRRAYARGTKSEHDALMLETPAGTYLLRHRDGPAFGDTVLEGLIDATVSCDGTLVDGRLLLVDSATIVVRK